MSLPKYDCAAHPSTLLDPARASPLDSNRFYILSVYDQERVPADEFSFGSYDRAGWASLGLARFSADDRSFHIADHKIPTANWNEALHALSWSDAYEGTARVPVGSLRFSDDLQSFLGIVMSSDGQKRTISGLIITGYHTKRARKDGDGIAFDSYDLFYGAVRNTEAGPQLKPLCQIWDPDNYDDDEDHGLMYDVSSDAHFTGGIGSTYVKPRGTGEYGYVSFDIQFSGSDNFKKFEGTFSNDTEKTMYTWTGASFEIPANIRKLIEDSLKKNSVVTPPDAGKAFVSNIAQESAPAPPSYDIDIYLPITTLNNPPPYTPGNFAANVDGEPGMSELKLWQISSIKKVKDEKGDFIATDIVQDYVGKASNNIFMASLPGSAKKKFGFTDPYLQKGEKDIMEKHAKFNSAASIPFFAQALRGSAVATPEQKNEINEEKVKAWFSAMSSLEPPKGGEPDPVVQAGLKRDDNLKTLQDAYSAQMDDLYKFYYKLKVADFDQYCLDQPTAQTWFDKLRAFVESDDFVAQWVSLNSDIKYKDGSREIMEASVKLNILEDVGYPNRAAKDRQTPDIIKVLAGQAAMAFFATSVGYDPTLEKQLEDLINAVGDSTEEEIRKKYGDLIAEFQQLQILLQAYGGTRAFCDWFLKVMKHYGAGGGEAFNSLLQMAGDQMKNIWNKFKKGKPKDEIIAEFGKEAVELAEEPMKDPKKWEKIQAAWGKFKGGVKSVFSHLALAASAAALIAVAAGQWGAVDTAVRVYLGLEAFAYALKGLKLFASTALGKLIKTHLLDNKAFLQRVGEWFSKEGIPKDIPKTSILGTLVGKNVKVFLERLGAVLAVAMVVVCAFDFKNALASGKPMDIAESAIYLVLAIVDVAVVATGIVANLAGASAVAACAGPIGLAIAAIGLVVAIVFFILKLLHPEPPPDPVQDFINDELDKAGFKKK